MSLLLQVRFIVIWFSSGDHALVFRPMPGLSSTPRFVELNLYLSPVEENERGAVVESVAPRRRLTR